MMNGLLARIIDAHGGLDGWNQYDKVDATDQRTMFTPGRIAIEKLDGAIVAERHAPRDSFAGHQMTTPWDRLHRAYFNGYAMWIYLTTPFLLAMDGVRVEKTEPWRQIGYVARLARLLSGLDRDAQRYSGVLLRRRFDAAPPRLQCECRRRFRSGAADFR